MNRFSVALGILCAAVAGGAHAHVVFADPAAVAGGHWAGALRVSHGCDGSATKSIRVEIPREIVIARARVPAGWTVVVEREPLASPVASENGALLTERVNAITWTGHLPDDQFEEFGLAAKLPATPGALAFKVIQTCERGALHWTEAAAPGGPRPAHPAAVLELREGAHH